MRYGRAAVGPDRLTLDGDRLYLFRVGAQLADALVVGSIVLYLDGAGGGSGQQVLRPAIMEADRPDTLVLGDVAIVQQGQAAGWFHMTFDEPARLRAGADVLVGVHAGGASGLARLAVNLGELAVSQRVTVPYGTAPDLGAPSVELVPNGGFEQDLAGWTNDTPAVLTATRSTTWAADGEASIHLVVATGQTGYVRTPQQSSGLHVAAGALYRIALDANAIRYSANPPAAGDYHTVYVQWWNGDAFLDQSLAWVAMDVGERHLTTQMAAPATANRLSLAPFVAAAGGGPGPTEVFLDNISVRREYGTDLSALASIVVVAVAPWTAPDQLAEDERAELPIDVAQDALAGGPVDTIDSAVCGWHYSNDVPPPPASAIVRTGGPLDHLVGERIRVTTATDTPIGPASVTVAVVDEQPFDVTIDEDLSLAREAFMRLGALWADTLTVRVEVLG